MMEWDTCFFFFSFSEMSARLLLLKGRYIPENQGDFPNQIFDEFSMNDVGPCLVVNFHHSLAGITPYGSTPTPMQVCLKPDSQVENFAALQRKNSCCQFAN